MESEIVDYLKLGTSPINIHAGGDMAEIVANTTQLSDVDLHAMAVFLKSLPALDAPAPGMPEPNRTAVVRRLPVKDVAEAQSKLAALGSPPAGQTAAAAVEYVVMTKNLFDDSSNAARKGAEFGKVMASTRLAVLERSGFTSKVRIDGWQQDGTDGALYALQGQRIIQAVLTPAAVARLVRSKSIHDPLSNRDWHQASLLPYVVGSTEVYERPTAWPVLARSSDLVVFWGADPVNNNQIGYLIADHGAYPALDALKAARKQVICIGPVRTETCTTLDAEWIAPRPQTDVAMMLGIAHTLYAQTLHDERFLATYTTGFDKFLPYLLGQSDGTPKTAEWAAAICDVPAAKLKELARRFAKQRTMLNA